MNSIQIQIDKKWETRIHSKWFKLVQALRGVALSFCPLFIYWAGGGMKIIAETPFIKWPTLLICTSTIFWVSLTYMKIADQVVIAVSPADPSPKTNTPATLVALGVGVIVTLLGLGAVLMITRH